MCFETKYTALAVRPLSKTKMSIRMLKKTVDSAWVVVPSQSHSIKSIDSCGLLLYIVAYDSG